MLAAQFDESSNYLLQVRTCLLDQFAMLYTLSLLMHSHAVSSGLVQLAGRTEVRMYSPKLWGKCVPFESSEVIAFGFNNGSVQFCARTRKCVLKQTIKMASVWLTHTATKRR